MPGQERAETGLKERKKKHTGAKTKLWFYVQV